MKERVQKLMAQANIGSRRACEEIIRQGRVQVNGQVIQLGDQADPYTDVIEVDGEKLAFSNDKVYIAFNKPRQVLSTNVPHKDDTRRTVRDYIPLEGHLFSIGRLDADSDGLIVLTNDGELANKLTHPRYHHTKTYRVVVYGLPTAETIEKWQTGVHLEEGMTAPCSVEIVKGGKETTLRIVMTEGKKRQIRRIGASLGHHVKTLTRTHLGELALGTLRPGEWRELTPQEVALLSKRQRATTAKPVVRPKSTPQPPRTSKPERQERRKPTSGGRKSGRNRGDSEQNRDRKPRTKRR
ncbi:MAG: rRNA pseudouridine synthase [Anaerolineaceae bacterium]|nr:rRNA pseudouridine synthase [Anaerolineaceae bacterium]